MYIQINEVTVNLNDQLGREEGEKSPNVVFFSWRAGIHLCMGRSLTAGIG